MSQNIESQVEKRVHISHRGLIYLGRECVKVSIYQAVNTFMRASWLSGYRALNFTLRQFIFWIDVMDYELAG